jgi:type I restriction enzyme, S subunit
MSRGMSAAQRLLTDQLDLWSAAETGKKSGRGRSAANGASVYGIKKLRELILELAMRGKLVPQDVNDEPASELLKQIQAEKSRLAAEGKAKKDKPLAKIKPDEVSYQLPDGWAWVRFGDTAEHNSGKTLDNGRNTGSLHDYITTSNLYWGKFELANVRQMPIRDEELEKCTARKDDLLICEGGEAGRAAVWPHDHVICFQNHVHRARFYCDIDPYYAFLFFEKLDATGEINEYRKGVGISNMSGKALASIIFPLPPLSEQHRIVAKVDELMALCDQLETRHGNAADAHEQLVSQLLATLTQAQDAADFAANWQRVATHFDTLFCTEASIDALKQTLLQLAVMGKLVPQDQKDEPASELLKRYGISLTPSSIVGWSEALLGELGAIYGGATPSKANSDYWIGDIPWVSPKDMKRSYIGDSEDKVSKAAIRETTLKLIPAESLLMVVRGMILAHSFPVALSTREVTINQDMKALVVPGEIREYLLLYMRAMRDSFVALVDRSSHGTCKLLSEKLWTARVVIPPLAEQHRIVAKVDQLMALCDQLKSRIVAASQLQQKLADALVEQALA